MARWSRRQWAHAALVLAVIAAILWVAIRARSVLLPFVLGLFFAYLLLPLVNALDRRLFRLLRRHGPARILAILLVYLAILGLIVGFFTYLVPVVARQVQQLIANLPQIVSEIQLRLAGFQEWYNRNVPQWAKETIENQIQTIRSRAVASVGGAIAATVSAIGSTVAAIFGYLIIPFWLIYVFYDADRFGRGLASLIPEGIRPDALNLRRLFDDVVVAYVRGQLLVASITGALTGLGLALIGVDFPVLLGLITAIGDLIPTLGPILAAIPIVLIAVLEEPILGLWALLVLVGVQQLESLLIGPRVVGDSVRLSPAIIILLLIVAGEIGGFLGLLVVVPLAAFLRDVVRYLSLRTSRAEVLPDDALRQVRKARRGDWG